MRIFKAVLSSFYATLSLSLLVLMLVELIRAGSIFTLPYLVLHLSAALLSSWAVVMIMARVTSERRGAILALLIISVLLLSPIFILCITVQQIIRAVLLFSRRYISKDERLEFSREDRQRIYQHSCAEAIKRILDPADRRDIVLDNGEKIMTFRKTALINLGMQKYALLTPEDERGDAKDAPVAYKLDRDRESGARILTPVRDETLYRRIYAVYEDLADRY